jgi:hypothetical protein
MEQQITPPMQLIIIQSRDDVVVNCLFQFSATRRCVNPRLDGQSRDANNLMILIYKAITPLHPDENHKTLLPRIKNILPPKNTTLLRWLKASVNPISLLSD